MYLDCGIAESRRVAIEEADIPNSTSAEVGMAFMPFRCCSQNEVRRFFLRRQVTCILSFLQN
jgi:hypothetical protein